MIKKRIEYTFFTILNIYLSAFLLNIYVAAFIVVLPLYKVAEIVEKYYHIENFADNVFWYSFLFGIPIFSMLLKILVFPILYKIKFLSNIKDFLERFATDKKYLKKVLLFIFLLDVIFHLFYLIVMEDKNFICLIYDFKDIVFFYLLTFFGVLPCYLSFLIWYKWTHRKKRESV